MDAIIKVFGIKTAVERNYVLYKTEVKFKVLILQLS